MKTAWRRANLPIRKDAIIVKILIELKEKYQVQRKSLNRFTEEQSEEYSIALDATLNIAIVAWRDEISQDPLLLEEQKEAKVALMEDYVGKAILSSKFAL